MPVRGPELRSFLSGAIQSDRVFEALRGEILACRMAPGAKIKIPLLCARFQSSPGAVREALSRLLSEGLVQNMPQKGFSVAPVSMKELHDLTQARIALESICLEGAFALGDIEWESQIVAAFHRLSRIDPRLRDRPDELNPTWSLAHGQFHGAIVAACSNEVLLRLRAQLFQESERYRCWCLPLTRGDERDVAGEHKDIFETVLARDLPACRRLLREHFQRTADILAASPAIGSAAAEADRTRKIEFFTT
jgi:GntR family carbon starvation induced transcriptional regulator